MHSAANAHRPLDHLVLPTADLETARARLGALGFTVAPVGVHPFGTANCCVYFADGAFLEALAVRDPSAASKAITEGNVFVARDQDYRRRHGEDGFSALVMATSDARADDLRFRNNGFSAGEMLAFSRPFMNGEGEQDTASFLLAFAADPTAANAFFFTCERVNAPKVDRDALQSHANSANGIAEVVLSAAAPRTFSDLLREVTGLAPARFSSEHVSFQTPNTAISIVTPDILRALSGIDARGEQDLRLRSLTFTVRDPGSLDMLLERNGIACERRDRRVIVAPAAGQGAHFIFEAAK